jgi:hypothetical protein
MPFTVIVVCIYCLRSCLSIIVLYLWIFLVSFRLDIDGFYFLWILDISILIFHYQIGIVDYYFFRFVVGLFSILDCWTVCFSDCFFLVEAVGFAPFRMPCLSAGRSCPMSRKTTTLQLYFLILLE